MRCILLQAHNNQDIEDIRKQIIQQLTVANPSALPQFMGFSVQYQKLVDDFFDTNNHEPMPIHVSYMEKNLLVLAQAIKNPAFSSVKHILTPLYPKIAELVTIFKNNAGSRNYVFLGFKVRKFKYLLPDSVKKRGDWALFLAIRHRLLV